MKKLGFKDYYEPPFKSDGTYIWANNGMMALMPADEDENTPTILNRTCEVLNGDSKPTKVPDLQYEAPEIILNGKTFLVVRGWGALIGGVNHLDEKDAARIQDEFAAWVIAKLKGEQ